MYSKIKVSLNSDLRKRFGLRSFAISEGDIVKVRSGSRKGEGGKVVKVDHVTGKVSVEGLTIAKADGKQKEFFLEPSSLVITRLDLSRQERLARIREIAALKKITISEPTPEELAPPESETEPETEAEPVQSEVVSEETSAETQEKEPEAENSEESEEEEENDQ